MGEGAFWCSFGHIFWPIWKERESLQYRLTMPTLGDTRLRNVGEVFGRYASLDGAWAGMSRIWHSYRAKYVTGRNARMTPFWHCVFFAIGLNYMIEYSHLKAHNQWRKY